MSFKKVGEILPSQIIANIKQNNSKASCSRCGAVYTGEKEPFTCFTCKEKEKAKRVEEDRRNSQVQYLLKLSNISFRHRTAIFEPKTEAQNRVAKYLVENFSKTNLELRQSTDMLLFGAIGTGKTYISCAFAIELIHSYQTHVKYITEYELLSLYFEKRYQEFKNFRNSKVLILDEIGKRVLADWQRIQLEELLSYRYNEMLPTVYITNLALGEFREFLGDRLASRLKETGIRQGMFAFGGEDLRGMML